MTKFQPQYFSRKDGWQGITYPDAIKFCSQLGDIHMVCPFKSICSAGLGETPIDLFVNEDEPDMLWVPGEERDVYVVVIFQSCMCPSLTFCNSVQ